jgi:hypothetical protein
VSPLGIQRNSPDTSSSGLRELDSITYTGSRTKPVSRVRKIRRDQTKERGAAIGERGAVIGVLGIVVLGIGGPPSA